MARGGLFRRNKQISDDQILANVGELARGGEDTQKALLIVLDGLRYGTQTDLRISALPTLVELAETEDIRSRAAAMIRDSKAKAMVVVNPNIDVDFRKSFLSGWASGTHGFGSDKEIDEEGLALLLSADLPISMRLDVLALRPKDFGGKRREYGKRLLAEYQREATTFVTPKGRIRAMERMYDVLEGSWSSETLEKHAQRVAQDVHHNLLDVGTILDAQQTLRTVATLDPDRDVRLAAVQHMANQQDLLDVALTSDDSSFQSAAIGNMSALTAFAFVSRTTDVSQAFDALSRGFAIGKHPVSEIVTSPNVSVITIRNEPMPADEYQSLIQTARSAISNWFDRFIDAPEVVEHPEWITELLRKADQVEAGIQRCQNVDFAAALYVREPERFGPILETYVGRFSDEIKTAFLGSLATRKPTHAWATELLAQVGPSAEEVKQQALDAAYATLTNTANDLGVALEGRSIA